jgi:hypothetical protein
MVHCYLSNAIAQTRKEIWKGKLHSFLVYVVGHWEKNDWLQDIRWCPAAKKLHQK